MGHYILKKEPKNIDKECICEIDLKIPGNRIFARSEKIYFEVAVKDTIRQLNHQLSRAKEECLFNVRSYKVVITYNIK